MLPRRPEQPVDRKRQERSIEAVDDGQPGELGHRQRRGHRYGSDCDPRHEVGAEVRARISEEERDARRCLGQRPRNERVSVRGERGPGVVPGHV